jgi:hypothetical protein
MEIMIALWVVIAVATALIARSKGHSAILWFFLGALFGIFALLFSLFLKSSNTELKYH